MFKFTLSTSCFCFVTNLVSKRLKFHLDFAPTRTYKTVGLNDGQGDYASPSCREPVAATKLS